MTCPTAKDMRSIDVISLLSLMAVLIVTGVSIFIWMAAMGMSDMTGISVAVLFLLLAGSQVLFAVFWWRSKQRNDEYLVNQRNSSINKDEEMQESSLMEKSKGACKQE